ncbi:hypothetical protein RhiirA4_422845 [Rhizophagus irregularis]|uniref:Uncharacterized protein n=1 Tax=Rhizophagus irregularis TaxID=588596 RepID=A0A2I1GRS5_9GLOM|nr:hypothetical protein RhiirA4_422845 [Rhizophagus irregularis]
MGKNNSVIPSTSTLNKYYVYLLSVKVSSLLGLILGPFPSVFLSLSMWVGSVGLCGCGLEVWVGSVGCGLRAWVCGLGVWVYVGVGWECGLWVESVGWECGLWVGSMGLECGWVKSVGWECGLRAWVGSIYSSPCLIVIHAFVVAVFETPVPLKNIRNQVNQVIKVTKAIKDVKVVRFMQMSSNIVLDQAARSEGSDLTAYSY